ncbi:MAG TPA: hypothetical protein VK610_06585, partial [Rhodothermales bacterium]|nr:hypothetical protein [Rhodothermales bacterium]
MEAARGAPPPPHVAAPPRAVDRAQRRLVVGRPGEVLHHPLERQIKKLPAEVEPVEPHVGHVVVEEEPVRADRVERHVGPPGPVEVAVAHLPHLGAREQQLLELPHPQPVGPVGGKDTPQRRAHHQRRRAVVGPHRKRLRIALVEAQLSLQVPDDRGHLVV